MLPCNYRQQNRVETADERASFHLRQLAPPPVCEVCSVLARSDAAATRLMKDAASRAAALATAAAAAAAADVLKRLTQR